MPYLPQGPGTGGGGAPTKLDFYFGSGADGDVTLAANTTLTKDMYYKNLTVNSGVTVLPAGNRIYVRDTLTMNGTIGANGGAGNTSATRPVAGAAGGGGTGTLLGPGAASKVSTSTTGPNGVSTVFSLGGFSGAGGAGAGGAGAGATATRPVIGWTLGLDLPIAVPQAQGQVGDKITGGASGGGGGGSTTYAGGTGGGGGGVIFIAARTLINNGTIIAVGGRGGNGVSVPGTRAPGGGGGGGAIILVAESLTEGTQTVTGGAAGTGGSGGAHAGSDGTYMKVIIPS